MHLVLKLTLLQELFSGEQTSDDSQAESPSIPLMLAPPSPGDLREPIHIPNVSPENFKILLDFIYDGFGAVTNIQSIVAKFVHSVLLVGTFF
jgi:hypothetical protein